jgi:Ca-activated chloride channel family protein
MTRAAAFAAALSVSTLAAQGISATALAAQARFRAGVDLVALTVTVTDRADKHIAGLTEADFVVTEDGVPQPLSFFASGHVPLDLAIVLDTSGSMQGGLRIAQEAACGLARTLGAGDRGAVVEVKSGANLPQPLTDDVPSIEAAIRRTTPGGNTGLYDGLYVVLKELASARRDAREVRRQALVVLSDGVDNASHLRFEDVLDLARRTGVAVYVISPKTRRMPAPIGGEFELRSRVLYSMNALVRDAGGRIFFPGKMLELPEVYGAIGAELANQYELGYVPIRSAADGGFRRVAVRIVGRAEAQARTRAGYIAGASRGSSSTIAER